MKHVQQYSDFQLESLAPEIQLIEDTIYDGPAGSRYRNRQKNTPKFDTLDMGDIEGFAEHLKGWFETAFASRGNLKRIVLGTEIATQKIFWRIYDDFYKRHVDIPYEEKEKAISAYNYIGTEEWKHDHRGSNSGSKFGF